MTKHKTIYLTKIFHCLTKSVMFTQRQFHDSLKVTLSENNFLSKILRSSYLKVPSLSNNHILNQEGGKVTGSILIILESKTEKTSCFVCVASTERTLSYPKAGCCYFTSKLREDCFLASDSAMLSTIYFVGPPPPD